MTGMSRGWRGAALGCAFAAAIGCTDVDSLVVVGPGFHDVSADSADSAVDSAATDADTGAGADAVDGAGGGCQADAACDDGNPCTDDRCTGGSCTHLDINAACDDGNACTLLDVCGAKGVCTPGAVKGCDDGNPCTADGCNPATGACGNTAQNALPCSDGDACTTGDVCSQGGCNGAALACDDGKVCTTDGCDKATGCAHAAAPGSVPCDDGDLCTFGDACEAGACKGGAALGPSGKGCDDGKPCTADTCDPKTGCVSTNSDGTACDDGLACSKGDACKGGACKAGDETGCGCNSDADCQAGDDGDACNGKTICDKAGGIGKCAVDPKSVVTCPDGGPCATSACDKKTGACSSVAKADATACDADGDLCTVGDACVQGACKAGAAAACDDKNPCTTDSCKPAVGCVQVANEAVCDADGNPCTVFDACKLGACQAGSAKICFDGNPCTFDACDAKTGQCVADAKGAESLLCDADGSACTLADSCADGVCKAGQALGCDDGNPCTADGCHPLDGCKQTANAAACEDGDLCSVGDACQGGKCTSGGKKSCDDGDKCTIDACNGKTGLCSHDKLAGCSKPCSADGDCKDDNACTADVCDSGTCASKALNTGCDDGNTCTVGDACLQGSCAPGNAKDCNDSNPCTDDSCHPVGGCGHAANAAACDADGDACTAADVCKDKACSLGPKKACDDGSPCSKDSCDAKTGLCQHDGKPFAGDPCDADGSVCTVADACASGACVKGKSLACDDKNPCTADTCDPKAGCQHAAQPGSCEDGSACTSGDACSGGVCKAGASKPCDDGDVCTTDGCDATSGACTQTPIAGCANFCKSATDCDDGKPCTGQSCDKGNCVFTNISVPCADVDKCATGGTCKDGACSGAKAIDCNDGKPCTTDACDSKTGQCQWVTNTATCDDGNPCTEDDACKLGTCQPGKPKTCDDKNACTTDACDPKSGSCLAQNQDGGACDDGSACTSGDACSAGKCVPTGLATTQLQIGTGKSGFADGAADKVQLDAPWAIGRGPGQSLVFAELGNHRIRQWLPTGEVKTLAGTGKPGHADGDAAKAQFYAPSGIDRDSDGNLYVADLFNHRVRKIGTDGKVSTVAGTGKAGWKDGFASNALFDLPVGIAVDAAGIYVSEQTNHTIRLVTWEGQVITVAGQAGKKGLLDGPGAQSLFDSPYGLAIGPGGGLYIADSGNHRIRFLTASGSVLTAAGSNKGFVDGPIQVAKLDQPMAVAAMPGGELIVADRGNKRLRVLSLDGTLKTIHGDGSAQVVSEPFGVAADFAGHVAFVSFDGHIARRLRLAKVVCDDGNTCTTDACDAVSGACKTEAFKDGTPCGVGCATGQTCKVGVCAVGFPKDCDDDNPCTSDSCSAAACKNIVIPGCK